MAEDLIILFLVVILLVAAVGTTREHMTEEIVPPSKFESYNTVTRALKARGPTGTFTAFDAELKKNEDLVLRDENE